MTVNIFKNIKSIKVTDLEYVDLRRVNILPLLLLLRREYPNDIPILISPGHINNQVTDCVSVSSPSSRELRIAVYRTIQYPLFSRFFLTTETVGNTGSVPNHGLFPGKNFFLVLQLPFEGSHP